MPIDRFVCLATGGGIMLALLLVGAHPVPQGWDKVAHFACFAAALDGVHQMFMPARSAEFLDFVADAAAALAVCGVLFIRRKTLCVESSQP